MKGHAFEASRWSAAVCAAQVGPQTKCSLPPEDKVHSLSEVAAAANEAMRPIEQVAAAFFVPKGSEASEAMGTSGPPEPAWQRALRALESAEGVVDTHQKWEWRKYRLDDEGEVCGAIGSREKYSTLLGALDHSGTEYAVSVYRPGDVPWRTVLVTWGPFRGMALGEIVDLMERLEGGS